MEKASNICQICEDEDSVAKYMCPRCGIPYCSAMCYRNESKHLNCSESFYKDCVMQNMKSHLHDKPEDANKMKEILKRFNENFNENDDDTEDLLEDDEHNHPPSDLLDSDDDEPLEARMRGINLDDTDAVWNQLTEEEKADFKKLIKGNETCDIIPEWIAWWTAEPKKSLIEELPGDSEPSSSSKISEVLSSSGQPAIISPIPPMSSLTKVRPNDHVKIGLTNVIAAYAWTSRIYAGEVATNDRPEDVAGAIITLSAFLSSDTIFETFEHAVTNVPMIACQEPTLFDGGPTLHKQINQDVLQILSSHNLKSPNSNKSFVLSALSDCLQVLSVAVEKRKSLLRKDKNVAEISTSLELCKSNSLTNSKLTIEKEAFTKVFPSPPPLFSIDSKSFTKAKRKVHYLLAFANEYDVL